MIHLCNRLDVSGSTLGRSDERVSVHERGLATFTPTRNPENVTMRGLTLFLICSALILGLARAQDCAEPIPVEEFIESEQGNNLLKFIKLVGGSAAFDVMVYTRGEFATKAIVFTLKFEEKDKKEASYCFVPFDPARPEIDKRICFRGKLRGEIVDLIKSTLIKITEVERVGIQAENNNYNETIQNYRESYFFIKAQLLNPKASGLIGGWVFNPKKNSPTETFLKTADSLNGIFSEAVDKQYPDWRGNFNLNKTTFDLKLIER